ncbi:MAG: hypothetical protein COA78_35055 [Blastopirellula sp.]|nr:MAG: hypothetical protein COA78_35055 [Blastopirellula sp.]
MPLWPLIDDSRTRRRFEYVGLGWFAFSKTDGAATQNMKSASGLILLQQSSKFKNVLTFCLLWSVL